jgi:pimeloyl-ACP methyl ester carboxylesterase
LRSVITAFDFFKPHALPIPQKKQTPDAASTPRGDSISIHVLQEKLMPEASKYKSLYALKSQPGPGQDIHESIMSDAFPDPHFIETNGIRMAVYEKGQGPAVILLHGFPELAYSWRHQLPALAAAGYRAIAPDQRGYGRTDCPANLGDYRIQELVSDIEGLLSALDLQRATFVGHDWGALLLWHLSLVRPELIERQVILNIPFYARPPADPLEAMREKLGNDFYIVNFNDAYEADQAFAADPAHFFTMVMRKGQITREQYDQLPPQRKIINLLATMAKTKSSGEPLLSDDELHYYTTAYTHSGFTGPINWYRHWTHNWQSLEGVDQRVRVPTLFIGATNDVMIKPEHIEAMKRHVPDLEVHMIENCGHWTQQEKPDELNALLLNWLQKPTN